MAGRVFFHIGPPKSGTTYLQDILWKNKKRLASDGVLLPARRVDNFHATMVVRENPHVHKRHHTAPTAWARILEETRQWEGTAIISHEFFGGASAEQTKRVIDDLSPAEVHVVVTARDYVRLMPAAWQQWVKTRYWGSLTDFIREDAYGGPLSEWGWRTADIAAMLDRWGRHLPPEQVHVVTVPQSGAPPDLLWKRFADLCGIDPDSCDPAGARPNQSLGVVETELMRRVSPNVTQPIRGTPRELLRWLRDFFAHQVLAARQGQRFGLSADDAALLREKSRQAADSIDAAGYHVVGDLSELIPPDELPELPHPDSVTETQLVEAAAEVIAEMLQHYRTQTLRGDEQKRRAVAAERALAEANAKLARLEEGSAEPRRVRRLLIALSEQHRTIMRARRAYRRMTGGLRERAG